MPRCIGLMSFYSERPSWLAGCIASYIEAGITHLIALDGAYAMFPDGRARSTTAEVDAILEVCNGAGIHLTLVRPDVPWQGNEVEKRTALFRYAEVIAQPDVDWLFVIDADEVVTLAVDGWLDELARTDLNAADVTLVEVQNRDTEPRAQMDRMMVIDPVVRSPIRKVFRAKPGIYCAGNHYTYVAGDGEVLWDSSCRRPAVDLTDMIHIDHRTHYRTRHRWQASQEYYAVRDKAGIEADPRTIRHARPF